MENLRNKKTVIAFVSAAAVLLIHIVDVLVLKTGQRYLPQYVLAGVCGIVIAFTAAAMQNDNLRKRCLGSYGRFFELLYGAGFASAALAVVYVAEFIYLRLRGYGGTGLSVGVPDNGGGIKMLALFAVLLAVNIFFEEIFRGYLICQLYEKFGFKRSNLLQSLFFTLFGSIPTVYMALSGGLQGKNAAVCVVSTACAAYIGSMKWGFYYRVNGSVWMAGADHFITAFILSCVTLSSGASNDVWFMIRIPIAQLVSSAVFVPFYYRRDRYNSEMEKEIRTSREVLAAMRKSEGDGAAEDDNANNIFMLINETNQNRKFAGTAENEVVDLDRDPSSFSEGFFGNVMDDTLKTDVDLSRKSENEKGKETTNISESSGDISRLVGDFFENQFNKNTFN